VTVQRGLLATGYKDANGRKFESPQLSCKVSGKDFDKSRQGARPGKTTDAGYNGDTRDTEVFKAGFGKNGSSTDETFDVTIIAVLSS
jgi:hypothetical protein